MDRFQKLVGDTPKHAKSVEIGALCRPLLKKPDFNAFYVDYANREFLIERYKNDPNVVLDEIVEVDGIWGEQTLSEATKAFNPVDFIVASHVIEHVPNLIEWLKELASILKEGGQLSLAIPDQRYTFDFLRRPTHVSDVLDSYFQKRRTPSAREVFDHLMNFCHVHPADAWANQYPSQDAGERLSWDQITDLAHSINQDHAYHDVHCLIFTPISFVNLMIDLAKLQLHQFACDQFFDTQYGDIEFIVRMKVVQDRDLVCNSWSLVRDQLISQEKITSSSGFNLQAEQSDCSKMTSFLKQYLPVPLKNILRKIRKHLS